MLRLDPYHPKTHYELALSYNEMKNSAKALEHIQEELCSIIQENPIVQNLIIEGIKANKFIEKLLEIVSIKERSSFIDSNFCWTRSIVDSRNSISSSSHTFNC